MAIVSKDSIDVTDWSPAADQMRYNETPGGSKETSCPLRKEKNEEK